MHVKVKGATKYMLTIIHLWVWNQQRDSSSWKNDTIHINDVILFTDSKAFQENWKHFATIFFFFLTVTLEHATFSVVKSYENVSYCVVQCLSTQLTELIPSKWCSIYNSPTETFTIIVYRKNHMSEKQNLSCWYIGHRNGTLLKMSKKIKVTLNTVSFNTPSLRHLLQLVCWYLRVIWKKYVRTKGSLEVRVRFKVKLW